MHTDGSFSPGSEKAVRERYEELGSTAQLVVKEVAKAMELGPEEYEERVTSDVVETARDVLFAQSLEVRVGTREEFEEWRDDFDGEVQVFGAENVEHVVWHAGPGDAAVAATFQQEEDAAVGTLRRQAFGHVYTDLL